MYKAKPKVQGKKKRVNDMKKHDIIESRGWEKLKMVRMVNLNRFFLFTPVKCLLSPN